MSGFGEGIGAVIEGGLLASAVEPEHGAAGHGAHESVACANCTSVFSGHYCSQCGQKAHVHRSLAAIGHDIMHGVLHLDGKLWDTLPLLTFKPGALTRRYIAGERAKFVGPMAMFLFSVFAMFAVFQMVGISAPTDLPPELTGGRVNSTFRANVQEQIVELQRERDNLPKDASRRAVIETELTGLNRLLERTSDRIGPIDIDPKDLKPKGTGIKFLDEGIINKWQNNPSLMLYKLQSNGYKFSWLLIPLSIPFLWLMFAWRRQFKAYDHAVFVTYSLSFMSLLFIVISIISVIPDRAGWAAMLFFIGVPLHLYKQLRYAYGLSRFSAVWRFCLLLVCMQIVLVLFLQALLVLGAF